ncbi:5'-adenylylsulfate reductase-like 4 [Phtheirospermum japonicum]|uniref:5'-adenylylsulfate reductase-like 4 n=1 Tax=Phtheirospermum japonicum TaxID=374723 RepID=A0A830CB90_9LAMI|nr:5'-adenylylsulfate reductase-like 4 [Phtheirospermum japonicum]
MAAAYGAGLALFLLLGRLICAEPVRVPLPPAVCPLNSIKDIIFASQNDVCSVCGTDFSYTTGVIEGDEVSLQKALNIIHKNEHNYVALLFYSLWCPFSGPFRPSFSVLSSIFPTIPHFAIEESAVRPSILSKYGVHGFPTLILLNSTMRMRYQGSRTLDSLISFYDEFTGIKISADRVSIDKIGCSVYDEKHENNPETCPFPWARSPENLFQQETYLTLATLFVILRLLHFFLPTLRRWAQLAWRRYTMNVSVNNQVMQLFSFLKDPCKKRNLQEGAKNAKAWASKSLATVSFGDASSSRDA